MTKQSPYQSYKHSRQRRQTYGPLIMGVLAIVFVAVGVFLIFIWLRGAPINVAFLTSPTPTPTNTATPLPPTATSTITLTPTITSTSTEIPTATPDQPFQYTVLAGDSLFTIADQFQVEVVAIMLLNNLTNESIIFPGDVLTIPNPGMGIPTPTPLPPNLPRGSIIDYFVLPGDSLRSIADQFLTTIDAILEENELEDPNQIFPGQILKVPYYIITPTFGPPNSPTPTLTPTPEGPTPTFTSTPGG